MKSNVARKKKLLVLLTSSVTMLGVVAAVLLSSHNQPAFSNASNEYTMTLNSSNGGGGFPSSYGSGVNKNGHTNKGNVIDITYSNVKSTSNKYCTVANGGYLYNSTQITGLESVSVSFSGGSLSLYSSKSTSFSGDAKSLTSGTALAIDANYDYFKLLAGGETVIESITAVYTCSARPEVQDVTDVITATDLVATGSSYQNFSGVKKSSDAVYAGNSAKDGSGNIQLRSKNSESGIVSTTSGGYVKSVKITVGTGTKTVDVYGSNSAFNSAEDLYGSVGTKVGSVSSTGTINFTGDNANFEYVGIRSNDGAVYLSSVEITWTSSPDSGGGSGEGGDTPTPTPTPDPEETVSLTASFPYENPEPSSIDILREDESVFGALSTSISSVDTYDDTHSEYVLAKNEYILITNSNPNVTITSIDIKIYQYRNVAVYVDGSSSPIYNGDGSKGGTNEVISVEVNASSSVKVVCNGGGTSTSYVLKIYGVDLHLSGIEGDTAVSGVTLNKTSTTITQEGSEQLTATVAPSYATNKNVTWSTSNSSVATVSNTGLVSGVNAGTAIITVTTEDGGFTATCNVTVTAVYHVTGVSLSPAALALHPGENSSLTATITPSNATNKNVAWSTNNSSVATVSGGTVSAKAAGTATITVTTEDGGKTASCTVTVTDVAVTGVTLNKSSVTITRLGTETLTATIAPANATNQNINWSSSNTGVATVSNGTITGVSAGSATITATSAADSTKKATCTVTVNPIVVSSVSLNKSTLSLGIGVDETLIATVNPSNADNTNINWSTSDSSVATVSGGTVHGVAEGTATITAVSAADSSKKATCTVNVAAVTEFTIDLTDQGFSNQQDVTTVTQSPFTLTFDKADGSNSPKYYDSGSSVRTYATNTLTVETSGYDDITKIVFTLGGTTTATPTSDVGTYNGNSKTWTGSAKSIVFTNSASGQYHYKAVTITVTPSTPVPATGVSLPSAKEISVTGTSTLPVTYSPSNANTGLALKWSSSATSVAEVDQNSGVITPKTTGTVNITAQLVSDSSKKSTCTVTVVEQARDKWTILVYMCGANLESDYASSNEGCATSDLQEIASVTGQPDDVNVVVQAGGATKWSSTYSNVINKDKCNRFHLSGNNYEKDSQTAKENMGEAATLRSFISWGLQTYPADNVGLIFWDHGGAITGACFDDQFLDSDGYGDGLYPEEMEEGISKGKSDAGYTDKFEFIGYDCCIMQFQDLAGLNAPYAKYQIASEESEWGYGWSYDRWIDDLFAKKTTEQILTAVVDGFYTDTQADYQRIYGDPNNQTLSFVNLQNWTAYETAWESMASTLNSAVSDWDKLSTVLKKCGHFGEEYDLYDLGDFVKYMKTSSFSSNTTLMNKISAVETALNNLIVYEKHGSAAGNVTGGSASGFALFAPVTGALSKTFYGEEVTTLQTWRSFCVNKGKWSD